MLRNVFSVCMFTIVMLTISCSGFGKIKVIKDDLKGVTIVKMKLLHKSSEEFGGLISFSKAATVTYAMELAGDEPKNLRISVLTQGFPITDGKGWDDKCIFKINDSQIDCTVGDRVIDKEVSAGKNAAGEIETTTIYKARGVIELGPDVAGQLAGAKEVVLRMYVESEPLTFKLSPDDIEKIQKFAATRKAS